MNRWRVTTALASAAFVLVCAPAHAGTLTVGPEAIGYSAAPDERNEVRVEATATTIFVADTAGITAPAECRRERDGFACPRPEPLPLIAFQLGNGDDSFHGGAGSGTLQGRYVFNVFGGSGADRLRADEGELSFYGEEGDDLLTGSEGDDYLNGSEGDDRVVGGAGSDQILGVEGKDVLSGGDGDDSIRADEFLADPLRDRVSCGPGNDTAEPEELDVDVTGPRPLPDTIRDDCETVWLGLNGGPVQLLQPLVRGARLGLSIPCGQWTERPLPCPVRAAARTTGGRLVASARSRVPVDRRARVTLNAVSPFGREVLTGAEPYTLRVSIDTARGQRTGIALRITP